MMGFDGKNCSNGECALKQHEEGIPSKIYKTQYHNDKARF
jgi:hypothetical protein